MRIIKEILITDIIHYRLPSLKNTFNLIEHIKNGGTTPPIKVSAIERKYILSGGRHRLLAYKFLNKTHIKAKYYVND